MSAPLDYSAPAVTDPHALVRELRVQLASAHQEIARLHGELATTRAVSPPAAVAAPRPPLLRVREVAALLRVTQRTVRDWRARKFLPPAFATGAIVRWRPDVIEEWIDSHVETRQ